MCWIEWRGEIDFFWILFPPSLRRINALKWPVLRVFRTSTFCVNRKMNASGLLILCHMECLQIGAISDSKFEHAVCVFRMFFRFWLTTVASAMLLCYWKLRILLRYIFREIQIGRLTWVVRFSNESRRKLKMWRRITSTLIVAVNFSRILGGNENHYAKFFPPKFLSPNTARVTPEMSWVMRLPVIKCCTKQCYTNTRAIVVCGHDCMYI